MNNANANIFSSAGQQQVGGGYSFPIGNGVNAPTPSAPGIEAQASELLRHLSELEQNVGNLRGKLFGEGEAGSSPFANPTCVAGMLSQVTTRIASLVGETSTILTRF